MANAQLVTSDASGTGTDFVATTTTYPDTVVISSLLYASAANVLSALAPTNRSILTTNSTGVPTYIALTDGQIVIGSTAGSPVAGSISAGTGISITPSSNGISIAAIGGGFTWTDVTGATQALAVENGYLTDRGGGVTYTLPAGSASIGDEIIIVGKLGLTTIAQNAGQQILMGSASSTVGVGGSVVGTGLGDSIILICTTSGTSSFWRAVSFVGIWTIN